MKNKDLHIDLIKQKQNSNKLLCFSILKFIFLLMVLNTSSFSQDKKTALEAKRKKLLEEIKFTQKVLTETKASKAATIADLTALSKQIELRQKLIGEVETEIGTYTEKINENISELKLRETQLAQLKKEYADAVVKTYKTQRFADKILFIANANSFSEALRRVNYLRKYASFRKVQAEQILDTKTQISGQIASINSKKKTKEE